MFRFLYPGFLAGLTGAPRGWDEIASIPWDLKLSWLEKLKVPDVQKTSENNFRFGRLWPQINVGSADVQILIFDIQVS